MKILQLGKFYPLKGGVEFVMYKLAEGLSERRNRCDLLYASTDGETSTIRINDHCHIFRSRTLFSAKATMISPSMIVKMWRLRKKYDIVHIHHPDPMAALALYLSRYKGKVVLHWHSDIVRQNQLLKYYKPLQSWLIRRADLIVCTSPVYLEQSKALKDVHHKAMSIPIGVSDPSNQFPADIVDVQGRYPDKNIIFTLGRLVTYKGFEHLIEAAKSLPDDYIILIGGMGYMHDHLQALIDKDGLHEKVKLIGYIPSEEVPSYFKACKLFCLSSVDKREAFAIVQIEAMAFGKPVVSTNIEGSGVPWVNKHGESGYVVPTHDSRALADAIVRLCSDEAEYQQFCRQSRQRYERLFKIETMIDTMEETYHKLMEGKCP